MKKELSVEEELDVVELKKSGWSVHDIAKNYMVSTRTIYRILKKANANREYFIGRPQMIIDDYVAGMRPIDIATKYNVTYNYVGTLIWAGDGTYYKRYHDEAKRNSDWFKSKQRSTVEQ